MGTSKFEAMRAALEKLIEVCEPAMERNGMIYGAWGMARRALALPDDEPVAYRISAPEDPEIGSWLAEEPSTMPGALNEPLYAAPQPPAYDEARERELVEALTHLLGVVKGTIPGTFAEAEAKARAALREGK